MRSQSPSSLAVEKKKAKNKAKNERRKARKAEAKKKKAEEEAAAADESQDESASEDDAKPAGSDTSVSMMKKLNATMEALPGKLAALATANVVKKAEATDVSNEVAENPIAAHTAIWRRATPIEPSIRLWKSK